MTHPSPTSLPRRARARLAGAIATAALATLALAGARTYPTIRGRVAPSCAAALSDGEVSALGVPPVAQELRAAWVSPVEGGEWPSRPDMSPEAQRAELTAVLDRAVSLGLNAVVLHVRTAADAMYPTTRAPWSSYLTRERGSAASPGYDPLAFAVAEAHRRGLQLHAWFNPFRAAPPEGNAGRPGAAFVAREHPGWVVRYGSQTWIDPGYPDARRAVLDAILEVVDRYDVDAVHLDDYFYPYQEERTIRQRVGKGRRRRTIVRHETIAFPDDASWRRYGQGGAFDSRGDWRRANVSEFIASLYRGVKARKPWVLVGVSPFGIWRPGSPPGLTGLDAYSEIFADSRRWLREGWVDYLAPQLYWQLDGEQRRFVRLDAWWRSENVQGRHVWPGLFTMRVASNGNPWPSSEIPAQIDQLRRARAGTAESLGHVHFRLGAMGPETPLGARLTRESYAAPALPPASPWLGAAVPDAPVLDACRPDSAATPAPIRVQKDLPEAPPIRVRKEAPDAAESPATGEMAATPRVPSGGPTIAVAPVGATPVRWWVVQLRDTAGAWHARTLPGDLRLLPVSLPDGTRATIAAVSAVSPSGVVGAAAAVRVE